MGHWRSLSHLPAGQCREGKLQKGTWNWKTPAQVVLEERGEEHAFSRASHLHMLGNPDGHSQSPKPCIMKEREKKLPFKS